MTAGPHLAMVGLMGSGKTTVGQLVASSLGLPFLDNDELLAERTGRTAAEVGVAGGEQALHDAEAEILLEVLGTDDPAVLATAASVVDDDRCRRALDDRALVVWLHGDIAVLAGRAASGGHRPFDGADPARLLAAMAARRVPLYEALADMTVDVVRLGADQAAAAVVAEISARYR